MSELFFLTIGFGLGYYVGAEAGLREIAIDLWDETKFYAKKIRDRLSERRD
jgi:hypothetical protein